MELQQKKKVFIFNFIFILCFTIVIGHIDKGKEDQSRKMGDL